MSSGPAIQVPGHARGICRSCKAAVIWVRTVNGKSMPLDVEETIGKDLVLFTIDAHGVAHRAPEGTPGRESHFSTCPDGPSWRKAR